MWWQLLPQLFEAFILKGSHRRSHFLQGGFILPHQGHLGMGPGVRAETGFPRVAVGPRGCNFDLEGLDGVELLSPDRQFAGIACK